MSEYTDAIRAISLDLKELATPASTSLDEELIAISNRLFELADDDIIECDICGDYHAISNIPLECQNGDGV